ncbi:MAG: hypothetical protein OXG79_10720 [Chloroflexi bacterium]|nr:hypothetical protein [Chloroflexota bacterium]
MSRPSSALDYRAVPSPAGDSTLADVVRRLAARSAAQGVALCGSGRDQTLTPVSDIDLLIVVDEAHAYLRSGVTQVDGRMGDLMFATTREIAEIATAESALDAGTWVGMIASHLERAEILFDRDGSLARAQIQIRRCELAPGAAPGAAYRAWNKINYDRQHNRRMLASDDPGVAAALDVRLQYGLSDVISGYFATRGLPWQGEKAAVRYLRDHDSAFLTLFQQALSENDRRAKFDLYERLCLMATAPVGGLWPDGATSAHLRDPAAASPEAHAEATAFIASLFEDG